ncbi:MAG: hypothetical protein NZ528_17050 [Caldilineales bacterium]|nr:hypothetical protein [Caldilineales bacterium]
MFVLTLLLWSVFLLCNAALFLFAALQAGPLAALTVLFLLAWELALLVRYVRWVAQWRAAIAFWTVYALARMAATALAAWGSELGASALMLVAVYAMLAGYVALAALAIRRDVSVAYLVIAFAAGPVLLLSQVRAAGGVLAWLVGQGREMAVPPFNPLEPALMAISCMATLALVTFVPHFLALLWREWRGASARQASSPTGASPGHRPLW